MSVILLESSDRLLCEDSNNISLEDTSAGPSFALVPTTISATGANTITSTWTGVNSPASDPFTLTAGAGFTTKSGYSKTGTFTATITLTVSSLGGTITLLDATTTTSKSLTAAAGAPDAPTAVSGVNQGNGTTVVTFTPPVNNGGSPITGYTVTGSDSFVKTGTASPITISNNGSGSVFYNVFATNANGTGAASADSAAVTITRTVAASFYVDNGGNYQNSGHSLGAAWNTITRANNFTFRAGDQLIFTAGQTFTGNLVITSSGAAGSRICVGTGRILPSDPVDTYMAQASPATIACLNGHGIRMTDNQYWSIDNLHIAGSGVNYATGATTSVGVGINIKSTQPVNRLLGNSVTAISITDVRDGICIWTPSGQKGHDGLRFKGINIYNVHRIGIILTDYDFDNATGVLGQGNFTQNTNVYFGNCYIHHVYHGEGFTIRNTTTGLAEYICVHDINGETTGLDTTIADGIVFQYCEVFNIIVKLANVDAVGVDLENSRNCVLQYSYIHDCDGAGYLSGIAVAGIGNMTGNVVRYNVFTRNAKKNQAELYNFGTIPPATDTCATDFYGNTVYATATIAWRPHGVDRAWNNIFVSPAAGYSVQAYGNSGPASMIGNLYYAVGGGQVLVHVNNVTHSTLAGVQGAGYEKIAAVLYGVYGQNPQLKSPTTAIAGGTLPGSPVDSITNFDVTRLTSPALEAGIDFSDVSINPGLLDFHGRSNTAPNGNYTIGADQGFVVAALGSPHSTYMQMRRNR